jgi:hypothetical protein
MLIGKLRNSCWGPISRKGPNFAKILQNGNPKKCEMGTLKMTEIT